MQNNLGRSYGRVKHESKRKAGALSSTQDERSDTAPYPTTLVAACVPAMRSEDRPGHHAAAPTRVIPANWEQSLPPLEGGGIQRGCAGIPSPPRGKVRMGESRGHLPHPDTSSLPQRRRTSLPSPHGSTDQRRLPAHRRQRAHRGIRCAKFPCHQTLGSPGRCGDCFARKNGFVAATLSRLLTSNPDTIPAWKHSHRRLRPIDVSGIRGIRCASSRATGNARLARQECGNCFARKNGSVAAMSHGPYGTITKQLPQRLRN